MEPKIAYTIGVLKCSNDIVLVVRCNNIGTVIINSDRKGWPDTEVLPDRSSRCAENSEIETVW